MTKNAAPKGLGEAGARLWDSIASKYALRPDELHVLEAACLAEDRTENMRALLTTTPMLTTGSTGQVVVHPLVAEIRAHEAQVASLLVKLKLPDESGPALNAQRTGGQTRWANAHGASA